MSFGSFLDTVNTGETDEGNRIIHTVKQHQSIGEMDCEAETDRMDNSLVTK